MIRSDKKTERVAMTLDAERREAYLRVASAEGDYEYQVVLDPVASEWHKVTVLDPVRLESARVTILPPSYARRPGEEPAASEGLGDMRALQFSTASLQLQFNRPPSVAWIEWKPENAEAARLQPAAASRCRSTA